MTGSDPWAASFITPEELGAGALSEVVRFYANQTDYLADVCVQASQDVEDRCGRRFLPFTDLVETHTCEGVDSDGSGLLDDGVPLLDLAGSLALSSARAFGYSQLVRDLWVHHTPPRRQDLWSYTACSITLHRAWGDTATLGPRDFMGPTVDTGRIRMRLGTLAPQGTQAVVTYSGGYILGVPGALKQAARLTAVKRLLLEVEPEMRPGTSMAELDAEILTLLGDYARI